MRPAGRRRRRREPGPSYNGRSRHAQHGSTPAWEPSGVIVVSAPIRGTLLNSLLGLLAGGLVLAAMPSTALAADLQGVWLTEDEDAALTITNCGGQLCGRIVWLESATDRSGSLRLDENNPTPPSRHNGSAGSLSSGASNPPALIRGTRPSTIRKTARPTAVTSPFCRTGHWKFEPISVCRSSAGARLGREWTALPRTT